MFKVSQNLKPISIDFGLLIFRIAATGLTLLHGAPKLMSFSDRWHHFANPIGLGSELSYILCTFAEFFCAVFLMVGAFCRLAAIPLICNFIVIAFIVHGSDPMAKKELPIFFLLSYSALFFTGPGKYSVDGMRR